MIKYYFLLFSAIVVLLSSGCGDSGECCLDGAQSESTKSPTPITLSANTPPIASMRAIGTTSEDLSSCTTGQLFNFDGLDSNDSEDGIFNTSDHYEWFINDAFVTDVNSSNLYGISCPAAGTSKEICLKVVDSDGQESENISCMTLTATAIVSTPTPCVAKITITDSSGVVIGSDDHMKYYTRYNLSSTGSTSGSYEWGASSSFNNGTTNCFNDDYNNRGSRTDADTWLQTCRYNNGENDYIDIKLTVTTSDGTTCSASEHRPVSLF